MKVQPLFQFWHTWASILYTFVFELKNIFQQRKLRCSKLILNYISLKTKSKSHMNIWKKINITNGKLSRSFLMFQELLKLGYLLSHLYTQDWIDTKSRAWKVFTCPKNLKITYWTGSSLLWNYEALFTKIHSFAMDCCWHYLDSITCSNYCHFEVGHDWCKCIEGGI